MRNTSLALLFMVLTGCAADITVMRYSNTVYPPRPDVEVLDAKPERPYEVIAIMNAEEDEDAIINLRAQAAQLGADAMILLRPHAETSYINGPYFAPRPNVYQYIDAVAIRYK